MGCLKLKYLDSSRALDKAPLYFLSVLGEKSETTKNRINYSPFGALMPGRSPVVAGEEHRYGYNGMELDDEIKSEHGTSYDFGARMLDPRVGRWLSRDPLEKKYPQFSPYVQNGNNPIIYLDVDGRDIVYFDSQGNETNRTKSNKVFKTYVEVDRENRVSNEDYIGPPTIYYAEAPMPNRITKYSEYEKSQKRDYNKYDYDIAAQTFLFNKNNEKGALPDKGLGGDPNGVPMLDPSTVKTIILQESTYGYGRNKIADEKDLMHSNNIGDWSPKKMSFGYAKEGVVDSYRKSISGGITWLYWKGITITEVKDDEGKITGYKATWTGGDEWDKAVYNYNGGGDPNYMSTYNATKTALENGQSRDYSKNKENGSGDTKTVHAAKKSLSGKAK